MAKINPIINPNLLMINGPVNVIRLEGIIHNVKKIIYLFMDYHIGVNSQTQCENIFSKDVQKYFVDSFYDLNNTKNKYDFFVELYPSELADENYKHGISQKDYKDKYIEEVVKLFRKIFVYDSDKNKVSANKYFQNMRLHYLDIRDYFKHAISNKVFKMASISHSFMKNDNVDIEGLEQIIKLLDILRDHMVIIVDILEKSKSNKTNKINKSTIKPTIKPTNRSRPRIIKNAKLNKIDEQTLTYLTNKIRSSYNNSDIKEIMNEMIDESIDNFISIIDEIDDIIVTFSTYADDIESQMDKLIKDHNTSYIFSYGMTPRTMRTMIVDITNTIENIIEEKFIEFFARFTDIYFLRRFLDKEYITNAIVYSGALHSSTYVSVLVKKFGFRVTHTSYSKVTNMTKLTDKIRKLPLMEMQELILPPNFLQCSDMTGFPTKFL